MEEGEKNEKVKFYNDDLGTGSYTFYSLLSRSTTYSPTSNFSSATPYRICTTTTGSSLT